MVFHIGKIYGNQCPVSACGEWKTKGGYGKIKNSLNDDSLVSC